MTVNNKIDKKLLRRVKCARTLLRNVYDLSNSKNDIINFLGMTSEGLDKIILKSEPIESEDINKNQLNFIDKL